MEIAQIVTAAANTDVIGIVHSKSNVQHFGATGKYVSIVLRDSHDDSAEIKLTLFGENVLKSSDLKVTNNNHIIPLLIQNQ